MLIEKFLTHCAARLTRCYLTLDERWAGLPPRSDNGNSYLLYVHIPFCEELCPYCSFVRVKFEPSLAARYFDALKKEIEIYLELGYCFDAIYIGGGTPTTMADELAEIIELVKSAGQIKQVSVETSPSHLTSRILGILQDAGTNRLSIGVQSFNADILGTIQRLKKYGCGEEIKEKLISVVGMFDTVNVDMIFNFPSQTEQMLAEDIDIIKETKVDQVTCYPLMVSGSNKEEIAERCGSMDYQQERRLYYLLLEQLADTYSQESVWCFSRQKGMVDEYIMNHDQYVGVGPGSFGYMNGAIYCNTFSVQQYISMVQERNSAIIAAKEFSHLERVRYHFLLKLISGSVNVAEIKRECGNRSWLCLWRELFFLFVTRSAVFQDGNIILTRRGRYRCLVLMRTLFSIVGDYRQRHTFEDEDSAPEGQEEAILKNEKTLVDATV